MESHDIDLMRYEEQQAIAEVERERTVAELEEDLVSLFCWANRKELDLEDIMEAVRTSLEISQDGKFEVKEI